MQSLVLVLVAATAVFAADWEVFAKTGLTVNIGIGWRSATEGFLAGAVNGVGNVILHSTNGGADWTQVNGSFNTEVLLLDLDAADDTVIVSGVFGEMYSKDDGKTFKGSVGGGQSQSVRYFGKDGDGGEKFGCAGSYFGKEGAAISKNGGELFTHITDTGLFTFARYGAYPSDDVFYLTAGEFPSTDDDDTTTDDDFPPNMARRAKKTVFQDENGHFLRNWKPDMSRYGNGTDNGYKAQLVKTTDGGKTWETQIAVNGTYYFNGIDCTTTEHCCAVGESDAPPYLGAGVHCTFDGGKTWNQTFYMPYTTKQGFSLIDIRFANDQLGWAVGGELGALEPKAYFVETTDGGKTWNPDKHILPGYYALGVEVVNEQLAFAAIDNTLTQQSALARWSA